MPLDVKYNPATDELAIEGQIYSGEVFRTFANPDPSKFYKIERDGDVVRITDVEGFAVMPKFVQMAAELSLAADDAIEAWAVNPHSLATALAMERMKRKLIPLQEGPVEEGALALNPEERKTLVEMLRRIARALLARLGMGAAG